MNAQLITTGIDQVIAEPGPWTGWAIRFRSTNVGLHHQLYANGRLIHWTEMPEQRSFSLDAPAEPLAVCVAAVPAENRTLDLGKQLPPEDRSPSWVYTARILRRTAHRPGELAEILGDHATGTLSDKPLTIKEIWPVWVARWAFGEDRFGLGGFGYDGTLALGMGEAAFGAGPFGMEAQPVEVTAPLQETGCHKIVLRTRSADGQSAESEPEYVDAALPGVPASELRALTYDHQNERLTLQII